MKNLELSKEQLESITPKDIKNMRKVKSILADMDISQDDPRFVGFMRSGIAARVEGEMSWKRVEAFLDQIVEWSGL